MKYLMALFTALTVSQGFAQAGGPKPQKIVDVVYKIQKVKDTSMISFNRAPTIYEVVGDKDEAREILKKLKNSQKNKKAVEVTVDNLSRRILEVKAP